MRSIVKNASVLVLVSMALTVSTRAQQPPQQPPEQPPPISTGVAPAPAPDGPAPAPGVRPPLPASPASPAGAALTERRTPQLFMPDGQLKSHSIRVYVTRDITLDQQPRLRLLRSHAVTRQAADEATSFEPGIVAPEQEWIERVSDLDVRRTGTLMLFDLRNMDFPWFKAMQRVTPVLTWTEAYRARPSRPAR